ncbi:flavin reductase family protein [Nonomuraea sp. LPB2021202275-12-8]|uniref:flavin reductase family protein n=1 Tax=Nonomuraea sp. LPB2021202275-12-8 TaxID=3120159 RepID=UPI00300C301E
MDEQSLAQHFRGFMSDYVTGVTVVTTLDAQNRPHGLTCTSLVSVTLAPPTLLVCLDVRSGTRAAIGDRGVFAVNLLREDGQRVAELFAGPEPDRFGRVSWRPSPRTGLPWLAADAHAMAECRVTQTAVVGDHAVVFGTVVHVERAPGHPLLYGMRAFCGVRGGEEAALAPAARRAPA